MKYKDIIDLVKKKNFVIECSSIELTPVVDESKRNKYKGPGSIFLSDGGYLKFKLYYEKKIHPDDFPPLGKIIGDEYYYNLIAKEINGDEWTAKKVNFSSNSSLNGSIITGDIHRILIRKKNIHPKKEMNYIQFFYSKKIEVPFNTYVSTKTLIGDKQGESCSDLSATQFKAGGIDFEIRTKDGYTYLLATSDSVQLTDKIANRIFESFQFVTADIIPWSVLMVWSGKYEEIRIKADIYDDKKSRIRPPINGTDNLKIWELFEKYLLYTIESEKDQHIFSSLNSSVIRSGKSYIEDEAQTLCISIESLLKAEFNIFFKEDENLKENISRTTELISNSDEIDNTFKNRIIGFLGSMVNLRAKDILMKLKEEGLISEELILKYGKLRDKTLHGELADSTDNQRWLDDCKAVQVLFNQLIFLKINYTGPYTDYRFHGYPTYEFKSQLTELLKTEGKKAPILS